MLNYTSPTFADFMFSNLSQIKIRPELWPSTYISNYYHVVLRLDMQPISKNVELIAWYDTNEFGEKVLKIKHKKEILEGFFNEWQEKMIKLRLTHLISEENCLHDFCVVNNAVILKPKPDVIE